MDKQGRILLPANLREYAGIDKEVVSVGVFSRVEIWSKERYLETTILTIWMRSQSIWQSWELESKYGV